MQAAADAELRGDPAAALRHYEAISMFSDSLHHQRLRQLVELGDQAPAWLWSRWLTVQARRPLWSGSDSSEPDPALPVALEVAYPEGIDLTKIEDVSMDVFVVSLYERDWVLRQLIVFEEGRLRELVDGIASPYLIDRADHVEDWASAAMGGFRLDSDEGGELQLTDLADGTRVDVLDLGLATEHWPGTHFLGRLVPTSVAPGLMFEWRPLPVDEETAQMVARCPDQWLATVASAARNGKLPLMFSYLEDSAMTSDLPVRSWMGLVDHEDIADLPTSDGLIDYDDVAMVVLGKLLAVMAGGGRPGLEAARHFAEALLLEPGLSDRIQEEFGRARFALAWRVLAGIVREPARSRCLLRSVVAAVGTPGEP
jgi:hypothetical protein